MSKRSWTLPALALALVVAGSGSSFAIPSLGGPTGVVSTPTAMVAPVGDLQSALSYQSMETESQDYTAWALQALTGMTDKAELWAAYTSVRNEQDSHMWGLGGKLQLTKEPEDDATLAVGASFQQWLDLVVSTAMYDPVAQQWIGEDIQTDVNVKKAYLVVTKDLTPVGGEGWEWGPGEGTKMFGSLGLIYVSLDPDEGDAESLTRPFGSLEFVGAGGTTLGLEYRWKDDDVDAKSVFSAVLRHRLSNEMTVEVGTTNADPAGLGLEDQDWFVRLGYDIPLGQTGW